MKRLLIFFFILTILLSSCGEESSSETESSEKNENTSSLESLSDTSDNSVQVIYKASEGGYVFGSSSQTLLFGEGSKSVIATPKLCYTFKEWSDGVKTAERSGDVFNKNTTVTAIFEYSGLPEIYIEYTADRIHKSYPINASFSLKNAGVIYEFENQGGQIQGRGNSTWDFDKKPYKIKFDNAVNLLGIGEDSKRDWVLLSEHGDQSLFRNYAAYNIANKLKIGYKSTLVEVYLNGKYNGVYLLTGKVEESRHDIDSKNGGFLIELDDYYEGEEGVDYFDVGIEHYTVHSDLSRNQIEEVKEYISTLSDVIANGDEKEIKEYIDVESFVNMYLLQEYTKNIDVGWSSFYLYKKDKNDKLHMGPAWDFDIAMGNDVRLDNGGYDDIYVGRTSGMVQQLYWFIHLCETEWFRADVLNSWNLSFKNCVSETLYELCQYAELNFKELEYNFVRWDDVFGKRINCEPKHIMALNTYKKHYDFFVSWMNLRKNWLDECLNNKEIWEEELKNKDNPRETVGLIPEI